MPRVFDNIDQKLLPALADTLEVSKCFSDKLNQEMQSSIDGATLSQAIVYNDELAKDIAETLEVGEFRQVQKLLLIK